MSDQGTVSKVSLRAKNFAEKFYKLMDTDRASIIPLYAADAPNLCEWNGHALPDINTFQDYLAKLPPTKHEIFMIDAQPLPGNEGSDSFLLVVQGNVTYDTEHKREFYQRLVIRESNSKFYIMNDYYRWLGEK